MTIWNPYAFGPTGQPVVPQSPPALRVEGQIEATPQQRAMAQAVFHQFVMVQRVSLGPNPVQAGLLPDGSPYRITATGPQTIMQIWPVGGEDEYLGGIGIVLTDLEGGLLPGHILVRSGEDDQAQPYILTPVAKKGTRDTTGKWKVRKQAFNGGKASFYHLKSKRYLVGMDGTPDELLPPPPGGIDMTSVNVRANQFGFRADGTSFYVGRREEAAGVFRTEYDMLPFFRRNAAGQLCWVQIVPEFLFGTRLRMYAGLYEPSETAYVGELVDTLEMPDGYSLVYTSISPGPDGNTLRAVFIHNISGSPQTAVDMAVSDTALSITAMQDYQTTIPGDAGSTSSGTLPTGITTVGYTISAKIAGVGYGYDGKGQPALTRSGSTAIDSNYTNFRQFNGSTVGDIETTVEVESSNVVYKNPTAWMSVNGREVTFPRPIETVVFNRTTTIQRNTETQQIISVVYEGQTVTDRREYAALLNLVSDISTDFVVQAVNVRHFMQVSHPVAVNNDGVWSQETVIDSESETYTPKIQVMAKGVMVDEIDVGAFNIGKFVATIAADPLTGAICCNVLEFTSETRDTVARSWIYVADDQGGRRLSQIMNVDDSRDIRIRNDNSLRSV